MWKHRVQWLAALWEDVMPHMAYCFVSVSRLRTYSASGVLQPNIRTPEYIPMSKNASGRQPPNGINKFSVPHKILQKNTTCEDDQ
jgi:hypothetical protein